MALSLPRGKSIFLPKLPPELTDFRETHKYLQALVTEVEAQLREGFTNVNFILSTGTSGTFDDSAGNTVTVQSGIITALA